MLFADSVFVGVDVASDHKAFTYAALDRELNLLALAHADAGDVVAFLAGQNSVTVAVNAPSQVNHGIIKKDAGKQSLTPRQSQGFDMRVAEYELRARGIAVHKTEAKESLCPAWVKAGFGLYKKLSKQGFKPYPEFDESHRWLETNPHACFCVLLERVPLPARTLEGRLQRGLILHERGLHISDPMIFFEEITRHRLLNGQLPMELVHKPAQLDALAAAYTAWLATEKPADAMHVGYKQEGFITLPVNALKEKYYSG
ncbi:MAG: DUF429 domain-containing protein [Chloroflexi bacterium]|nr:DUF429 domain-containing protein [Chloroflexota bacterium]